MASTSISKQTAGTPTNNKKFTFSFWVKRNKINNGSGSQSIYIHERGSGYSHTHKVEFGFHSSDSFFFGTWDGSAEYYSRTKRKFRDCNGWLHVVIAVDSTDGTNTNRLKWYFNGEQYSTDGAMFDAGPSYPAVNWVFNSNTWSHNIGRYVSSSGASNYLDAVLSDFCFVDGQALTPSSFGETDTDTGEWRVKDFSAGDITWGTNGYRILKDGNSLTDVSSNSHNFNADTGTLTKTQDCPNNVFATLNPLDNFYSNHGLTNGNTRTSSSTSTSYMSPILSTLGAASGKYYAECKVIQTSTAYSKIGIGATQITGTNQGFGSLSNQYVYNGETGAITGQSNGATYTDGDIVGIALDLDNNKLYFHKNGTYQNSGVPTSGSTGTGASSITAASSTGLGFYLLGCGDIAGNSPQAIWEWNFGNGYFGTTAVSSAGTNASGNGIFEYDVPTGYTALSTKGLNL